MSNKNKIQKISVRFLCGHREDLTENALDTLNACPPFKINNKFCSEAGEYCLACSQPKKVK